MSEQHQSSRKEEGEKEGEKKKARKGERKRESRKPVGSALDGIVHKIRQNFMFLSSYKIHTNRTPATTSETFLPFERFFFDG